MSNTFTRSQDFSLSFFFSLAVSCKSTDNRTACRHHHAHSKSIAALITNRTFNAYFAMLITHLTRCSIVTHTLMQPRAYVAYTFRIGSANGGEISTSVMKIISIIQPTRDYAANPSASGQT